MERKPTLHRAVPPIRPRDLHRIFGMVAPDQQGRVTPFPAPAPTDFEAWAEALQWDEFDPDEARLLRRLNGTTTLADDWCDFVSEVRASPYSHAIVAIAAIAFWTVLLVAPTLLGWWS